MRIGDCSSDVCSSVLWGHKLETPMIFRSTFKLFTPALAVFAIAASAAYADEKPDYDDIGLPSVEDSIIGTVQTPSDSRVEDEAALRPEATITLQTGRAAGRERGSKAVEIMVGR